MQLDDQVMKAYGVLSLVSASIFGVVLATLHFVEPEFNTGPISFYSLAASGFS